MCYLHMREVSGNNTGALMFQRNNDTASHQVFNYFVKKNKK